MQLKTDKKNLLGLPQGDLEQWIESIGEKPYRARQLLQWIYQGGNRFRQDDGSFEVAANFSE